MGSVLKDLLINPERFFRQVLGEKEQLRSQASSFLRARWQPRYPVILREVFLPV